MTDKERFIEEACDWLNTNAHMYITEVTYNGVRLQSISPQMVEDFKNKMEKVL